MILSSPCSTATGSEIMSEAAIPGGANASTAASATNEQKAASRQADGRIATALTQGFGIRASRAAIAASRSSSSRARSTTGTSIILPSTVTAPTPSASALS